MKYLFLVIAAIIFTGCDYIPRTVYEIELKDGSIIKLACPVIDTLRSEFTYIVDGACIVIK